MMAKFCITVTALEKETIIVNLCIVHATSTRKTSSRMIAVSGLGFRLVVGKLS